MELILGQKRMTKVYIASPYTLGDVAVNVKTQIEMANYLIGKGFNPYTPLLCHFNHMFQPREYNTWTALMLDWLIACDVVLRLEGESKGADEEVKVAVQMGILVFYSVADLIAAYDKGEIPCK